MWPDALLSERNIFIMKQAFCMKRIYDLVPIKAWEFGDENSTHLYEGEEKLNWWKLLKVESADKKY